jgi:hypothetical protein
MVKNVVYFPLPQVLHFLPTQYVVDLITLIVAVKVLKSRSSSSSSFFHPHNCYSVLSPLSCSNYFLSSTVFCVVEIIHGFNTENILELTLQDITTLVFQKQTTPPFAYILPCLQISAFESEWSKKTSECSAVYSNVRQSSEQHSPYFIAAVTKSQTNTICLMWFWPCIVDNMWK